MKSIAGVISLIILTGCSSVVNDTNHHMKIESRDSNGEIVKGAKCNLSNDGLNYRNGTNANYEGGMV